MSTLILYSSSCSPQQSEQAIAQTLSYLRSTETSEEELAVIVLSSVGLDVDVGVQEGEGKGSLEVELVLTEDKAGWLRRRQGQEKRETETETEGRTVVVCLVGGGGGGGEEEEGALMEACAELGIHHLSSNRSTKALKNTFFRLSYLAGKAPTPALILPLCDVLSVAVDLTTSLHSPLPSSILLATFVAPPTPPLLTAEAAQESLDVREFWSGKGIPFPRNVLYACAWELENRIPKRGGSLTSPWNELVNLLSQRERGEEYTYVEEWSSSSSSSSLVASLQMNLLLAFVWVLALVSKNARSTSPAPLPLPLPLILTTNTPTTPSSPAIQTRLEIPTSPPAPTPPDVPQQIICSTELALLLLSSSSDVDSKKGGVLTVSAALGEEGCKQFRERLQKRAGWVWR